ncbi:aspartyl-phosphate phosphatase Spo0E family protein [Metabacillus sediminilitoris]|uniref:Aspartyl-phosphate phosphatase Spo0E family protein n=1 Tax=Metabacillus sediminilitoris TaxID=2567941 RepID=A0A4S4BM53_9BACI|nr:Spo0E family sporulation regulatory protein-aspartic acid phosphatase [Metabacillus sediminilitoris]THF75696.1 aspartyl-phosphate phosphatase Spo0E family protein [Metabacillus sediminilitoris]
MPQNEDTIVIEQKRKQLIHSAMTKGLTSSQTLRLSEELDAAILSIMKKQHGHSLAGFLTYRKSAKLCPCCI